MKYKKEYTLQIKRLLLDVGKEVCELYNTSIRLTEKSPKDYVTSADIIVDDLLKKGLMEICSNVLVYSEEQNTIELSGTQWVIDPIDGTANFILGIPHFAISIAFIEDNTTLAGFVYNPLINELYWTDPWNNSFLNENEIWVSKRNNINEMYGLFGFSANYKNITRYYNEWNELFVNAKKCVGILSPSLSICSVARGKSDFFIDFGCSSEGKIAAAEILRKAGGKLFNYDKSTYSIKTTGILAVNEGKIF